MKYKTIGAFKNVQNVPYCKADVDLKVGMGVMVDRKNKLVKLPASSDEAKKAQYIVTNINDKPEVHNYVDGLVVKAGEFVRADDLATVDNMEIEFAAAEIKNGLEGLAKGNFLVFGTDGLVVKTTATTGYRVYFEILELTAYMGGGVLAVIHIQ